MKTLVEFIKLWFWMRSIPGKYNAKLIKDGNMWQVYQYEGWGIADIWGWGNSRLEALKHAKPRYECITSGGSLRDLYAKESDG